MVRIFEMRSSEPLWRPFVGLPVKLCSSWDRASMQNVYQHILNCRDVSSPLKSCLPTWLKWDTGCCFTTLLADISHHCCPKQCKGEVRRSSRAKLTGHCCWKQVVLLSAPSLLLAVHSLHFSCPVFAVPLILQWAVPAPMQLKHDNRCPTA